MKSEFHKNESGLILTEDDFQKISRLLDQAEPRIAEFLEDELGRASIVHSEQLPDDVISMNSKVRFRDLTAGKELEFTLVYPYETNNGANENKVSVLAPLGSALIGLRVGQEIDWPLPDGRTKRLKVISVIYQPESER